MGRVSRVLFVCSAALLAGCSFSEPPEFRSNTEGFEPDEITPAQREEIAFPLKKLFGTPDEPAVPDGVGLDLALLQMAAGPIRSDIEGNPSGVYRQHCVACHGISGDGTGPCAEMLNPYPRDFRRGVFKYTSTYASSATQGKPVWEDLDRILRRGMPGTSMPSFETLSDREIGALIEYVKYLSVRGQTEAQLVDYVVRAGQRRLEMDLVLDEVDFFAGHWTRAAKSLVDPAEAERHAPAIDTAEQLAASIDRGYELYLSENARCYTCHGPNGEGDGEQAGLSADGEPSVLYDDWNKAKKGATPEETRKRAARFRLPIQPLRPRDFTTATFRGGGEPIDIYWRIHVGIQGTPMPASGTAGTTPGVLAPEQIWDVVNYVRSRARW